MSVVEQTDFRVIQRSLKAPTRRHPRWHVASFCPCLVLLYLGSGVGAGVGSGAGSGDGAGSSSAKISCLVMLPE